MSLSDLSTAGLPRAAVAALLAPKTHRVVTRYQGGLIRILETRNEASAQTHADFVERPKLGRDLIDRATGATVRVVSVDVERIAR